MSEVCDFSVCDALAGGVSESSFRPFRRRCPSLSDVLCCGCSKFSDFSVLGASETLPPLGLSGYPPREPGWGGKRGNSAGWGGKRGTHTHTHIHTHKHRANGNATDGRTDDEGRARLTDDDGPGVMSPVAREGRGGGGGRPVLVPVGQVIFSFISSASKSCRHVCMSFDQLLVFGRSGSEFMNVLYVGVAA